MSHAPMSGRFPRRTALHMPKLGQIPHNWLTQQRDVIVPSLGYLAFVLVQFLIDAADQFGPIGMQATLPTSGIARKQPVLVAIGPKAIATFALSLTFAWSLQKRNTKMRLQKPVRTESTHLYALNYLQIEIHHQMPTE